MNHIHIIIAEDDPSFSAQVQSYLQQFAQENQLDLSVIAYSDGAELVEHYHGNGDILLLDVDMPGMDGLTAAKMIRKIDTSVQIIFITNLAQYAIRGYEVNALDYVLKPISYYALSMKLRLALRILRRNQEKSILLNRDGDVTRVPLSHLYYVEIYSHQLCYHTAEGDITLTTTRTLTMLEEELGQYGFVRCHKGLLINLRYVDTLQGTNVLVAGKWLPVSRNRRKAVLEALLNYAKGGRADS